MKDFEIVDFVCGMRWEEAMRQVADEFGLTPEDVRMMINDPDGKYESYPAYDRYYEVLGEYIEETIHS